MDLPDFLIQETERVILSRMLNAVPDDLDKSEGSYIYDALAAVAAEVAQMKVDMGVYLNRGFASTTYGEYLDHRCEEHGIARRSATKSKGKVKFTGDKGTVIEAGKRVATVADSATNTSSIEFVTSAEVKIPGNPEDEGEDSIIADVEAVVAGASGNVRDNVIKQMVDPISGISTVTNETPTAEGIDAESDSSLLARFLARVRNPATSGNKADYKDWALEVSGVGDALVLPLWNGPGTVKVLLVDADRQPATQKIVDDVQAYIAPDPELGEGKAPIGARVTVAAAERVDIFVKATLELDGTRTIDEIRADFNKALEEYLKSLVFTSDPIVYYVKIGAMLVDTDGVKKYSNLLVNDSTTDITITDGYIAVLRETNPVDLT